MKKWSVSSLIVILSLTAFAFFKMQSFVVTGTVTDDKGIPVSHVSVSIKGTKHGTQTDSVGKFSITINNTSATLVFNFVGFDAKEVKVSKEADLKVALTSSKELLEDVIVTGYKNEQKRPVSGGISSIKSKSIDGFYAPVQEGIYDYNGEEKDETEQQSFNREGYDNIVENRFKKVLDNPLSTFSIDVDAASYSNVRRYLQNGSLPPAGAVRIEELINYFQYEYPQPINEDPFSINTEISECPWNKGHQLALIGLQGKKIPTENLPASNLVFLIDVSGSMDAPNKLPLVKASLKLLVEQLRQEDKVSLVVYAGNAGVVLPATSGTNKIKIKNAIDNLNAGGSTAGGEGIKLAYKIARDNFMKEGNNRVILCTDGDFNVGVSSDDELERMIEEERKSNVFLSICGFGMGNYQDAKMQKLADKGNGNHSYIDGLSEAKKVFVNEFGGTLFAIAKDVKLQIEFNPAKVQGYRLLGYENRMLNKEDFNNDKKDAGELGSGHTVTALYEIIPAGIEDKFLESVDELKYQKTGKIMNGGDDWMTVKFRYKQPTDTISKLITHVVKGQTIRHGIFSEVASDNFRFAAAVAEFGMLLRHSEFKQDASWKNVWTLAKGAKGKDEEGYRAEFIKLVDDAKLLAKTEVGSEKDYSANDE